VNNSLKKESYSQARKRLKLEYEEKMREMELKEL
jgi:uncharacterized protein YaaW (UPF0174 family)